MAVSAAEMEKVSKEMSIIKLKATPLQLKMRAAARKASTLSFAAEAFLSCSKEALYRKAVEARKTKDFHAAETHFLDSIKLVPFPPPPFPPNKPETRKRTLPMIHAPLHPLWPDCALPRLRSPQNSRLARIPAQGRTGRNDNTGGKLVH